VAKLTKTIVDAAQPGGKAFFIWCGDLPGFGVRVHPSGGGGIIDIICPPAPGGA
jgi:hypothetical protein